LKIVVIANTSWYLFNFRKRLIQELKRKGHRVYCISPYDAYVQNLLDLGAKYRPWKVSARGQNVIQELSSCVRLFFILRKIRPDYVLTFTVKGNLYTGLCSHFLFYKQIANISGLGEIFEDHGKLSILRDGFYRCGLSRAKWVFFQNNEDLDLIVHTKAIVDPARCSRIPGSGVDLDKFQNHNSVTSRDLTKRIFLIYGRFVPKKGFDLFLQAARYLRNTYSDKVEFLVMGSKYSTIQDSEDLFQKILAYHRDGIIKYLEWSDDVLPILHQSDVIVSPTQYHEGVPRTLLEGMACGKPLITTDWKGARDTVDHGENGFLFKPGDCRGLIDCMTRYIEMSRDKLLTMGEASRNKAESEFNEEAILKSYFDQIQE